MNTKEHLESLEYLIKYDSLLQKMLDLVKNQDVKYNLNEAQNVLQLITESEETRRNLERWMQRFPKQHEQLAKQ